MENIFRSLSFNIVQAVYPLIPDLYGIIIDIGSNQYFTAEAIQKLSSNIYLVISVCMLFALGISLISAIVNPDLLSDKKKGVKSVALRSVAAIFLIILIPMGFNKLYEVQSDVVKNQLVEKIVLGMDPNVSNDPGQILAAYGFASFCEPQETVSSQALGSQGMDLYNKALTEDINYIKQMDGVINSKTNGEYDLQYNAIIAPAVGIYLLYQMIIIAIDIALRTIKLGMLQLIAPIILCGYVIAGTDILQKWFKMVMSTFVLLFLKMAMIAFMIFGLSLLPDFLENFSSKSFWYRGFLRMFIIIGLLQLIKQIPEIINNIFSANIKDRGGIRGRLGEMAGVGALAQRGWDQLRQHPLQTAQTLVSAPLSAVGGGLAHNVAAFRRAREVGHRIGGFRGFTAGLGTMAGGLLTTGGAMYRGGRAGWQNRNLQGIGAQGRRYEDTHVGDSTLNGRVQDSILSGLGLRTRQEQRELEDKFIMHNGRRMTFEELQARQKVNKSFDEVRSSVRSQIETSIDRENSGVNMSVTYGTHTINGNSASIRKQIEALSNATAAELGMTAREKAELIAGLNQQFAIERNAVLDTAENQVWTNGTGAMVNGAAVLSTGGDIAAVNEQMNHMTDLVDDNEDLQNIINNSTSILTYDTDADGNRQVRISNFRDGARNDVIDEYNQINRDVTRHEEQIQSRITTDRGREEADSNTSVHNRNNGGNNNGGGGNGH